MDRSDISTALGFFSAKHKEKLGVPYMMSYGKDQNLMKQILAVYQLPKVIAMMDEFFARLDTDEFLKKTGATVGIFKTQIPKLVIEDHQEKKDDQVGRL